MAEPAILLHRFAPRVSRVRRLSANVSAGAGVAVAGGLLIAAALHFIEALPALVIAALATGLALLAYFALLGRFDALLEPRAHRSALAAMRAGDRPAALLAVERAIAARPKSFAPRTLKGLLLSENGDYPGALVAYREAIACDPEGWIGWSGAGNALLNLGRLGEAVEALGKALALGGSWPVPRYQLGLALFLRGEYAGAAEAFGEALALGLEAANIELVARSLRAWALEKTGAVDAAREEQARARPLKERGEIGAFRDRLRGANLTPVGKLAAWAVGVDTSNDPPRLAAET